MDAPSVVSIVKTGTVSSSTQVGPTLATGAGQIGTYTTTLVRLEWGGGSFGK